MEDRLTTIDDVTPLPENDNDWQKEVPYSYIGLAMVIEYLRGDMRSKKVAGGLVLSGEMPAAYGRILRTTDLHGEEIDMYLAPLFSMDSSVYIIDQIDPQTHVFDEHKVMLGFDSVCEAKNLYASVFTDGSGEDRLGAITNMRPEDFLVWLATEGATLRPATVYKGAYISTDQVSGIAPENRTSDAGRTPRDEAGGVCVELADLSKGPKITALANENGGWDNHLFFYSALDIPTWSNTFDTFCRILDQADEIDTAHIHIASPGGAVLLMGRLISAINRTKAKVITYAEGVVASAACSIWSAGHERHILPGAYFMQHMSSQIALGKTTDIAAKTVFGVNYIKERLQHLVAIGLFTEEEIDDMVEKSADVYVSGRDAITRMGAVSTGKK